MPCCVVLLQCCSCWYDDAVRTLAIRIDEEGTGLHVLVLVGVMMLGSPQPLVLKSGTVLKCETVERRGEWVVVTLSPEDQHYKATGQGNTFKIDAEKVDWDKTDELRFRIKEREDARRQRNAGALPAVLDQDGLSQYRKRAEAQEQATQEHTKQEQDASVEESPMASPEAKSL